MRGDPRLTAVVKGEAIRSSVKRNHWDGSMFCTPAPRQCLRSSYHPHCRDPIGHRAGQHEGHASAIREAVGVDPRGIDVVGRLQFVDHLRDESDVLREIGPHAPDPRPHALESRRIDDNEALAVGQAVPLAQVHLLRRPSSGAVHADHEWRGLRAVVAARDVEQVLSLLARRNHEAVVPIPNAERERLERCQHHRQTDQDHNRADDSLPAHRCRFHESASGAAASRASGTSRIATSARTCLPMSTRGTIHTSRP